MVDQQSAQQPGVISRLDAPTQPSYPGPAPLPATPSRPPARSAAQHRAHRTWFRKKRANLPLAVGALFLVIMLGTGGNDPRIFDRTVSPAESSTEMAASGMPPAIVGQSVRDSKLAFIVASIGQPVAKVTDRLGATQTAQGVFVIVRVDVTNIGYEAQTLTPTDQFLVSDLGQRFATSAATTSLAGAGKAFAVKINPGVTVNNAPLMFDVPLGTRIASIELHGSPSSLGVKVALR